ncbi:MAG TPA: mannose-6-phosphate isomerase, partial [Paludibacteraceae bacterium]|nr:mannose-6-phosphate isomerase [Paludibacteraceae bacterium]
FFKTSVYKVTKPLSVDLSPIDSFVIWIGIEGSSQLKDNEGNVFSFSEGETILIPATTQKIEIEEPMKFLQVFI